MDPLTHSRVLLIWIPLIAAGIWLDRPDIDRAMSGAGEEAGRPVSVDPAFGPAIVSGQAVAAGRATIGPTGRTASAAPPSARYLVETGNALAPMGHVMFCRENAPDCAGDGEAVVELTAGRFAELARVNARVNREIRGEADPDRGGYGFADVWTVSAASGDCEDYALTKRQALIAGGWPGRALRVAVGRTPDGRAHAVLIARTTEGDLVLDNLRPDIVQWHDSDLVWQKIQSAANMRQWRTL